MLKIKITLRIFSLLILVALANLVLAPYSVFGRRVLAENFPDDLPSRRALISQAPRGSAAVTSDDKVSNSSVLLQPPVMHQPKGEVASVIKKSLSSNSFSNLPSKISLLETARQNSFKPSALLKVGDIFCFLGVTNIWLGKFDSRPNYSSSIVAQRFDVANGRIEDVPVQEFNSFVYYQPDNALVILDKAGNLFEFSMTSLKYHILRANKPFLSGAPDPDFVDLCTIDHQIFLLDPERNEIWRLDGKTKKMCGLFKEVLPWRLKPGDTNVTDGICLAADRDLYMLRRGGNIVKFILSPSSFSNQSLIAEGKRASGARPSRLSTVSGAPLMVVERENNRVLSYDKESRSCQQFLFSKQIDSWYQKIQSKPFDSRLTCLTMPLRGRRLPKHPGVFPGARRLYRYGVHEGIDFFEASMNTRVYAAASGKIVRADANFRDLSEKQLDRIMNECRREHQTSDYNEDLFRGCQVWIDHGGGLLTRYAHLNKINGKLKVGDRISRGELLGYVGVSGTGQSLPGRAKYPHLHFEIWLDGHYLGYGLTPQETIGICEDVFGKTTVD
jgi:murein DD-endopeptidase MepM/ murein hydrolase activator NlpD